MQTTTSTLFRHLTFYLVAWLCLCNFLFAAARQNPNAQSSATTVTASAPGTSSSSSSSGININVDANLCLPPVGKFCTYTQAQYGAPASKAASFLKNFFHTLFPSGLKIGQGIVCTVDNLVGGVVGGVLNLVGGLLDNTLTVLLSTCNDVFDFLPQLTSPSALTSALQNPGDQTCPGGLLSGDLVALGLNIALDAHVPSFSLANVNLSSLVFVKGACAGLSVKTVFDIANQVLGAQTSPLLSSCPLAIPAQIDACVAAVNANFLDAVYVGANLALPGLNLQACLNLNLPVITAAANVKATLLAPLSRSVGVYADIELAGLLDVNAAVTLANGQRYHSWLLDINANLDVLNVARVVTDLRIPVPSTVSSLVSGVVSDVVYVVDDVLCLVNYVLNFAPLSCTAQDLQAVIYLLTNPVITTVQQLLQEVPSLVGCNVPLVNSIVADAKAHGHGFVPAPGQVVGVVAKLNVAGVSARVFIELEVPQIDINISSKLCIAL